MSLGLLYVHEETTESDRPADLGGLRRYPLRLSADCSRRREKEAGRGYQRRHLLLASCVRRGRRPVHPTHDHQRHEIEVRVIRTDIRPHTDIDTYAALHMKTCKYLKKICGGKTEGRQLNRNDRKGHYSRNPSQPSNRERKTRGIRRPSRT